MAQAHQLIQTQTLTGSAASVTFSNIPQNFTDLRIVVSARETTDTGVSNAATIFNNDSSASYSQLRLYSYISSTSSTSQSGGTSLGVLPINTSDSTANTFGNAEMYIPNYTGSTYKSVTLTGGENSNSVSTNIGLYLFSGIWNNTAAITSIKFTAPVGSFATGSTFSLYGVGGAKASGGTITADANYTYHTFTSTGTFTAVEKIKNAEVLVIAGGGGGGANRAGGGGAGGIVYSWGNTFTAGTSYSAIVGSGGAGAVAATSDGVAGGDSMFGSYMAYGGGRAGGVSASAGGSGGSGAGSQGGAAVAGGSATQVSGTNYVGYGNAGGAGVTSYNASGGGGGAGAAGQAGTTNPGYSGNGGAGLNTWASWATATGTGASGYFAGGGGGGGSNDGSPSGAAAGAGGLGGGGNGNKSGAGSAGTANTGGGGGGGSNQTAQNGGAGGSGLIIVRYPNY